MSDATKPAPAESGNPFATRYIRPGALAYFFPAEGSLAGLIDRLADCGWRGEIVGPHGSGKSTLIRSLIPELASRGVHVSLFTLRQGMRRLPPFETEDVEWFPPGVDEAARLSEVSRLWIVDGAEQLSWFNWWRLRGVCWWNRCGLVVTTHRPLGLPTLFRTTTTANLAWQVVSMLVPANPTCVSPADVEEAFQRHAGNLRETLLTLFDVYQQRTLCERR
jgi:GTPase SAR1 family protein